MRSLSTKAEEPRLVQYNHWGQRIDDLQTSEGWRGLKDLVQKEGFVSVFYERKYHEHSRIFGFAREFLAVGDSQVVSTLIAGLNSPQNYIILLRYFVL